MLRCFHIVGFPLCVQCVLGSAIDFADKYEQGIIFHVSVGKYTSSFIFFIHVLIMVKLTNALTGGSLFNFLLQSRINITATSLYRMHCEERVKAIQVSNLLHLMAALEFIKLSACGEKTLVLLDGLSALFLAQKVRAGSTFYYKALRGFRR